MQQHTQAGDELLIRINAEQQGGRVASTTVAMPPAVTPAALVIGLEADAAVARVSQLGTHSPHAHAQALSMACAAALGLPPADPDSQLATERALAAEAVDA